MTQKRKEARTEPAIEKRAFATGPTSQKTATEAPPPDGFRKIRMEIRVTNPMPAERKGTY